MRRSHRRIVELVGIFLVASAHVGSPHTYFEGPAGPYAVRVIVRSPGVVPGLAQIVVRLLDGQRPQAVTVLPIFWDPKTAALPPPDTARVVPGDPTLYSAALWLMRGGSYSVQVVVRGGRGTGTAIVPVQAVATRRLEFEKPFGVALIGAGIVLAAGLLTIVGAAVRESVLPPGETPDPRRVRRARIAMGGYSVVLALALIGGRAWWNNVDAAYQRALYRPFHSTSSIATRRGERVLHFVIDDTSWSNARPHWTPLIPDHGHLMHLFLVRDSSADAFAHLHPLPLDSSHFESRLPPLPAGRYRVYADIVHESGFAQTLIAELGVPATAAGWRPSDPDDAWLAEGRQPSAFSGQPVAHLEDGSTMTWERGDAPLLVDRDAPLRFVVRGPDGARASLEPYMGMPGHAMIARDDGTVFVHLHPAGTIPLASQQAFLYRQPGDTVQGTLGTRLTELETQGPGALGLARGMAVPGAHALRPTPDALSFPYAFPRPGSYRIWVQVRRSGRILTGAFDAAVRPGR